MKLNAGARFAGVAMLFVALAGMGDNGGCSGAAIEEALDIDLATVKSLFVRDRTPPAPPERDLGDYCAAVGEGDVKAAITLALVYHYGTPDIAPDFIEAYKWYALAAINGHESAALMHERLSWDMAAEDVAEAERRIAAWTVEDCTRFAATERPPATAGAPRPDGGTT